MYLEGLSNAKTCAICKSWLRHVCGHDDAYGRTGSADPAYLHYEQLRRKWLLKKGPTY